MKDLSRNVKMHCSVCGSDQFSTLDDDIEVLKDAPDTTRFKCADCGKVFTKAELIEENDCIINANIEDMQEEIMKEFNQKLGKALKKLR